VSAQGRCAGCQETGELKAVSWHVTACPKWAALYRADPAAALGPAQEFDRWADQERPGARADDLAGRVSDTQKMRRASIARFKVADPLED
jgi:hypothetical protein